MGPVPASPYNVPAEACAGTGSVSVRGFPSSPFPLKPFTQLFRNPDVANKTLTKCTTKAGGACIDVYNIDVVETSVNLNAGCTAAPTKVVSCAAY
jgi:hypothetical protein